MLPSSLHEIQWSYLAIISFVAELSNATLELGTLPEAAVGSTAKIGCDLRIIYRGIPLRKCRLLLICPGGPWTLDPAL